MRFPAFMFWPERYWLDTYDLSDAEHGIYLRLLIIQWNTPTCRMPNDMAWLAAKMGRSQQDIEIQVKKILTRYCKTDGNWIYQPKLLDEYNRLCRLSKRGSDANKARWGKEKVPSQIDPNDRTLGGVSQSYPTPTPTDNSLRAKNAPSVDLKAELFGGCLKWMASLNGGDPNKYRSIMGKWISKHGEERVLQAFNRARKSDAPAGDPVAWMERVINPPRRTPQI